MRDSPRATRRPPSGSSCAAKLINPREEATLARLAAIHILARKPDAVAAVEKEVAAFCAKPGVFHHELAEVLVARKQYAQAEECYKKATELRPDLAGRPRRAGAAPHATRPRTGGEAAARSGVQGRPVPRPRLERAQGAHAPRRVRDEGDAALRHQVRPEDRQACLPRGSPTTWRNCTPSSRSSTASRRRARSSSRCWQRARCSAAGSCRCPGLPGAAQGASTGPLIAIPVAARRWHGEALQLGRRRPPRTHARLQPDADRLPRPHLAHRRTGGAGRADAAVRRDREAPARPARGRHRVRPRHHRSRLPQLRQPART